MADELEEKTEQSEIFIDTPEDSTWDDSGPSNDGRVNSLMKGRMTGAGNRNPRKTINSKANRIRRRALPSRIKTRGARPSTRPKKWPSF